MSTQPVPQSPLATELHNMKAIEAFESHPLAERYPWNNTYDLVINACQKWGEDTALEFMPTAAKDEATLPISYLQLAGRMNQTANLLHGLGVRTKDAVSIMLPTLPQTFYCIWGAQAAGITSPLNPLLEPHHLAEIIGVTGSKVLITMAPAHDNRELWDKAVAVAKEASGLTHMLIITIPGLTEELPDAPRDGITMVDYTALIDQQNAAELDSKRVFNADDAAAYMHTGGTTGRPKVAQLNHGHFAFIAQLTDDMTKNRPRTPTPCALPMFHIFGLVATGIAAFVAGRNVVILSPTGFRNPNVVQNFWAHVDRFKFQGIAAVPTILSVLYEVPIGDNDISSLDEIVSGAAPLPDHLKINFEKRFNCWVRNGYGMTESSCVLSHSQRDTAVPMGSCGLRVPYAERIVAHVDGNRLVKICEPNQAGVVLSRGPNIFAGYLEQEDNDKAWVDGWFNTGDMGYEDENGFLFLTGRAKDLIIRGGHNIDPVLIEEPLLAHPDVASAVAVGQPDPHAGELPMAFVVAKPGHTIDVDALLAYAADHISERAAIPKRIQVIDEIPLTAVAKIFKPKLREMATEYALNALLTNSDVEANVSAFTDQLKGLQAQVVLAKIDQKAASEKLLQSFPIHIDFQ